MVSAELESSEATADGDNSSFPETIFRYRESASTPVHALYYTKRLANTNKIRS